MVFSEACEALELYPDLASKRCCLQANELFTTLRDSISSYLR